MRLYEARGGGCLSLCQFPLRVVHLVLFPSLLVLSVKILSGHNFRHSKPISALMCRSSFFGHMIFLPSFYSV